MSRQPNPEKVLLWQARLDAHAVSGLSVAEFCKQQQLSIQSFYQWRRKLVGAKSEIRPDHHGIAESSHKPDPAFVQLLPTGSEARSRACIEIHLPSGTWLRLPSNDPGLLQSVLDGLRREL